MASIQYLINADIIDINCDSPDVNDIFFVDTNVWLWLTYSGIGQGQRLPQFSDYPAYISKCRGIKAQLFWCGLSMAELAHNIERTEREIHIRANGNVGTKEYRHNFTQARQKVISEIQAAWALVKKIGSPVAIDITEQSTDLSLNRIHGCAVDGYDSFFLEATDKAGICNIITDDGDYATVPGIKIFTANKNLIELAKQQNKLISRK